MNRTKKSKIILIVILLLLCLLAGAWLLLYGRECRMAGLPAEGGASDSEAEVGADAYFTNDTPYALEMERKYRPFRISDHSTLFFASDYQAESGFDEPRETFAALIASAVADGREIDAAVLCGDYTNDASLHDYQLSPEDAIAEIKGIARESVPGLTDGNMIFVQGNHDALTESIASSGLHEFGNYLIYVLNTENDFPWKQGKVSGAHDKVQVAAAAMKECFDGLIAAGDTRPVFIAGHVPLHYTARTSSRHTTGDNLYSSLIFDVVNDAARSLDIIYLFGHNHSKGWDCYMGGACVYKAPGDSILLPVFHGSEVSTDEFEERPLNFTYTNAGYTGYYMNSAPSEYSSDSGSPYRAADESLTATVCEVYKDRIEIIRYDADGRHVLGASGEANPYKGGIDDGLIDSKYFSREMPSPAVIYRKAAAPELLDAA